jgi:hypothetical protein
MPMTNPAPHSGSAAARTSLTLVQAEAYRRITGGDVPETLSDFASELAAWLRQAQSSGICPEHTIEDAVRELWHRRHQFTGTEL